MKKLLLLVAFLSLPAFGQTVNLRWDLGAPGSVGAATVIGNSKIVALSNVKLNWCSSPANAVPCTNFTPTYQSASSSNACPSNAPIVMQNSNTCVASSDGLGNLGVWAPQGTYAYTLTANGVNYGPYTVTLGNGSVSSSFGCGTTASPGIPYWNGTACIVDSNATLDGNGNESALSVTAPTGNFATLNTTGVGWVKTFKTQTAPANPASGSMLMYGDSGSSKWTCLNSDGSSCAPGGSAWSGVTAATNANAGTFAATGNTWDFTGVTQFKLRAGAGLTTSANGGIGYDTTNSMWHAWQNAADNFLITAVASGSYTNGDCTQIAKSGSTISFVDSGGACGGSGSAAPLQFGCGSAISTTATDFCGLGVVSTGESTAQVPVPRSGTVANLQCRMAGTGLSSTQTITITVRKGAASITPITSADTALTCTLNSTNTAGCSDSTHNFAVAAGDVLGIKTVPANSPSVGNVNCTADF